MRRNSRAWKIVASMLYVVAGFASASIAAERTQDALASWRVGLARVDVTPKEPVWLAGYAGRDRPSEGARHPLWVKALALEDANGRRAVILTADMCGFSLKSYHAILKGIKERVGLEADQVLLASSHTHTGPALDECLQDFYPLEGENLARTLAYTRWVEEQTVDVAARAFEQPFAARLYAGAGVANFAVNRRANKEPEVPGVLAAQGELQGPVDHRVPTLIVRDEQGALKALVFGYACHATTLADQLLSGDYPGFAQVALEEAWPGVQAMFHAGCGADQNPLPRRTPELCQLYGRQLAAAVNESLRNPTLALQPTLATSREEVELPYDKHVSREELVAAAGQSGLYARWGKRFLDRLDAGESFAKSAPFTVQAWRLGDLNWVQLGGETVVDYSLAIRAQHGDGVWVTAYAHDLTAYIPSRRVLQEGGYEADYVWEFGHPAIRFAPEVERLTLDAVTRRLGALQANSGSKKE